MRGKKEKGDYLIQVDICVLEMIVDEVTYFTIMVEAPIKKHEKHSY